jgi:hypothetical protein
MGSSSSRFNDGENHHGPSRPSGYPQGWGASFLLIQADAASRRGLILALALMIILFRFLIVTAVVSLLVGAFLPLDRPFLISVDLNQPPPAWLTLFGAFLIIALVAIVASGALLLFRGWGRWLGALAGLGGLAIAWLVAGSPIAESLSFLAAAFLALSLLAFLTGLAISYHPTVAPRFGHVR